MTTGSGSGKPIGVLLLHGFTSSADTVDALLPRLTAAGIDFERPMLRGHGTRMEDLRGVGPVEWLAGAQQALDELLKRVDRAVIVGLSMGGLLALDLAIRNEARVAGVVTVAAALKFRSPLTALTPLIAKVFEYWPAPNSFRDRECAKRCTNYRRFPTRSFVALLKYSREIQARLPMVRVPVCVLGSRTDQIISTRAAELIYERVGSAEREITWFSKSGHEMMQDCETQAVLDRIMQFVGKISQKAGKTA